MYTLYEMPPTRSNRSKWALEEIGAIYKSQRVDFSKNKQTSPEHLRRHPLGHVPVLRTETYLMHESAAIVLQLIDENPGCGLAPEVGDPGRALYYQWCLFGPAEMDHNLNLFMKHTMHLPEDQRSNVIAEEVSRKFDKAAEAVCQALGNRTYLLGSEFSGADIVIGYCCNWAAYTSQISAHPRLVEYHDLLKRRPAYQKVFGG